MRNASVGMALAMAVVAGPALAQTAPIDRVPVIQPGAGERVRINHGTDGAAVTGSWVGIDPYGVKLLATPEDTIQVALDRLVSLERLTGTKRAIGAGALIGSLVGRFLLPASPSTDAARSAADAERSTES